MEPGLPFIAQDAGTSEVDFLVLACLAAWKVYAILAHKILNNPEKLPPRYRLDPQARLRPIVIEGPNEVAA